MEPKTFKDICELCVVAHLKRYMTMTAPSTNAVTNHLFLSFVQLHTPVLTLTLSRCCVVIMKEME